MTLEVPNLFVILAFAFFFLPMLFLALYGCLNSFWRVKRKKKERHAETFVTGDEIEYTEEDVMNDDEKLDADIQDILAKALKKEEDVE